MDRAFRKIMVEHVEEFEVRFFEGDTQACLEALELCLLANIPAPNWAIVHFSTGVSKYRDCAARSLDEAFNLKRRKGAHLSKLRDRQTRGRMAYVIARTLVRKKIMSYDDAIAHVMKTLSMSRSTVERWYGDTEFMRQSRPHKTKKNEGD